MFLIYNKETEEYIIKSKYLRRNISEPVIGLNPNLTIFKIVDNKPSYDIETEYLEKKDFKLTDENYQNLKHIKIAYQEYTINNII